MTLNLIGALAGGLGLFLLGMRLMTQGLGLAAGSQLRSILGRWTRTPILGVFSGFLITALVQSSSAVTVAVIGFVNAGIMNLTQSIGVIFGANMGTTVTGWIVAAVGFSVDVKVLALPLIGLGAALRLTGNNGGREHLGDALAGFGLFFLGIEVLQGGFVNLQDHLDISTLAAGGWLCVPLFTAVGFVLTLAMQSSSAAMALVLTAALSGMLGLNCAAAAVVGTNIGTTSTAALSVIGATPRAKKVAGAHIIFNLGTGALALLALPGLLRVLREGFALAGLSPGPAAFLATFHTLFNVLGVLVFLPLTDRLVRFLERHVGRRVADLSRPRYLDRNVLQAPGLALDALFMETGRMGEMARLMAQRAIATDYTYPELSRERATVEGLIQATREFVMELQKKGLPTKVAQALPRVLRVIQYYATVSEIVMEVRQAHGRNDRGLPADQDEARLAFKRSCKDILNLAHTPCVPEFETIEGELVRLTDVYHALKNSLLAAGADGGLDVGRMAEELEIASRTRRMVEQAVKATIYWSSLRDLTDTCRTAGKENEYYWKKEPLE